MDESELDHSHPLLSLRSGVKVIVGNIAPQLLLLLLQLCSRVKRTFSLTEISVLCGSFGQSAIFLLGGLCRQDPPTAMYMHSGDMMVMSGHSRLRYHAVPRILVAPRGQTPVEVEGCGPAAALQANSVVEPLSQEDWAVCCRYIQSSRVNVTLRQVLGSGQNFPDSPFPTPKTPGGQEAENHDGASGRDKRKRCSVETAET